MSDKVDIAVRRLQEAAEMSQMLYEKPLVVTYSGGKDSDTILKLAQIAQIPFEVLHNHTTADAPEDVLGALWQERKDTLSLRGTRHTKKHT